MGCRLKCETTVLCYRNNNNNYWSDSLQIWCRYRFSVVVVEKKFPKKYVTFFFIFLYFFQFFFQKSKEFSTFSIKIHYGSGRNVDIFDWKCWKSYFFEKSRWKNHEKKIEIFLETFFPLQLPKSYSFSKSGDYPTNNSCCYFDSKVCRI